MLGLILKTLVVAVICLVVADIIGALGCTFFDVLLFTGNSPALPYAIWFVLGVFCGIFIFFFAGGLASPTPAKQDWTKAPDARRIGIGMLIVTGLLLAGLSYLFYTIQWSRGVEGEYYVPDSEPHSIVFFLSVLAGMGLCLFTLPTPREPPEASSD
jgi:hypothetical protein